MATASKLPAGSLDPTFGNGGKAFPVYPPDPVGSVRGFTVAPDGKLVLAGTFGDDYAIIRLEADGRADTSFGQEGVVTGMFEEGFRSRGASIILLEDGKILLSGRRYESELDNEGVPALASHHANGSLDTQFGNQGTLVIRVPILKGETTTRPELSDDQLTYSTDGAVLLPDDKILLIGNYTDTQHLTTGLLIRLNLDGTFDTSFNEGRGFTFIKHPSYSTTVFTKLSQPDGKIIVAGVAAIPRESGTAGLVARYLADGTLDSSFGDDGFFLNNSSGESRLLSSIALQDNGNIVAAGKVVTPTGLIKCLLLSLTASGTFDPLFNNGRPLETVEDDNPTGFEWISVVTQSDAKIVVQGNSLGRREEVDVILRRFSAHGTQDLTFGDETGLVRTHVGESSDIGTSMGLDGSRIIVTGLYDSAGDANPFVLRYLS